MPTSRTRRPAQTTFTRPPPAAVTYDLSARDQATIRVPPGSAWTSGPHWHAAHAEFLRVLAGRARVALGGRAFRVGSRDGAVVVPRGVVHEWGRADGGGADGSGDEEEAGDLVVMEWTEPKDGAKEVFFRNLNGLILDAAAKEKGGAWSDAMLTLELWNLFWRADNYPVVLGAGWVGGAVTRLMMGAAVALGWLLGCRGVYEEYSSE